MFLISEVVDNLVYFLLIIGVFFEKFDLYVRDGYGKLIIKFNIIFCNWMVKGRYFGDVFCYGDNMRISFV